MPLANTNGKTDWKCNISRWFQTDDFPLDPLMSGMASMSGCSQKVSVTNPVVSAELRGRAARGVGRRLSALPGALPEGESPLLPRARSLPAARRREPLWRRSAAGAGRGRGPSFPFPPRSPGAAAGAATGSVPGAQSWRCRRSGTLGESARAGPLPAHAAGRAAGGRGGEERPGIAAPEPLGCHHCSAGWPR